MLKFLYIFCLNLSFTVHHINLPFEHKSNSTKFYMPHHYIPLCHIIKFKKPIEILYIFCLKLFFAVHHINISLEHKSNSPKFYKRSSKNPSAGRKTPRHNSINFWWCYQRAVTRNYMLHLKSGKSMQPRTNKNDIRTVTG